MFLTRITSDINRKLQKPPFSTLAMRFHFISKYVVLNFLKVLYTVIPGKTIFRPKRVATYHWTLRSILYILLPNR